MINSEKASTSTIFKENVNGVLCICFSITQTHYQIALQQENADQITLIMDNLNTHIPGSLYEVFPPAKAKALWDRFEFVYTPKHGSWLNIAEIELNVLTGQCLKRRMDNIEVFRKEALVWQKLRNNKSAKVNWQFTTEDARIKLSRLYPSLEEPETAKNEEQDA